MASAARTEAACLASAFASLHLLYRQVAALDAAHARHCADIDALARKIDAAQARLAEVLA